MAFVIWPLSDTAWMVVLTVVAVVVLALLVVVAGVPRRSRGQGTAPVRGPPVSDPTW
jgi:heme/copper-type cytochrome/quinol oxidase subunit 2